MFSIYSIVLDPKTKQLQKNDVVQTFQNCYEKCKEPLKYCMKFCDDNHGENKLYNEPRKFINCQKICDNYRDICTRVCKTSNPVWGYQGPYAECQRQYKCFSDAEDNMTDRECILKHDKEILDCCLAKCDDSDCPNYCKIAHEIYTKNTYLDQVPMKDPEHKFYQPRQTYIALYIAIAIVISVIVIRRMLRI